MANPRFTHRTLLTFLTSLTLALCGSASAQSATEHPGDGGPIDASSFNATFSRSARLVLTNSTASATLRTGNVDWSDPKVNGEKPRGADNTVYEKVAPAVVVILSTESSGTGFALGPEGLIVTNDHVVAPSIRHDAAKGASYVNAHRGVLGKDGLVTLQTRPVRAWFLKTDPVKDLALLKLESVPKDGSYKHLQLAAKPARPGDWAAVVGHPSSGMLWTYRTGEVSAVGRSPTDIVDMLLPTLAAATASGKPAQSPTSIETTKILLSSVGCNPGDSGSPLVNRNGEVIAVTFAVPSDASQKEFTYHVHGDELRAFLSKAPKKPSYAIPDPWRFGAMAMLADVDGDGRPETLVGGQEEIEIMMFDLDRNSPPALLQSDEGFEKLISNRLWEYEFAVGFDPPAAYYDSDDDGTIDLVLLRDPAVPDSGFSTSRFVRVGKDSWKFEAKAVVPMLSARNFKSGKHNVSAGRVIRALRAKK